MSADDQLEEVAATLARGILRMRQSGSLPSVIEPANCSESGHDRLEVPRETRLSVTSGLRIENPETRRTA
jgi:hypothetical protein